MVYVRPFVRLVISGSTYGGEAYATGLNMIETPGGDGGIFGPGELEPLAAAWSTWFASTGVNIASVAKFELLKANLIDVNGLYANQTETNEIEILPPVLGSSGTNVAPQLTLCHTLTTDAGRGYASKGRIFPPLVSTILGTDGLVPSGTALAAANATATLINALNAVSPSRQVGIVSNVGAGAERPVTGVRVGRVMDTQRRRRRSIEEVPVLATTAIVA